MKKKALALAMMVGLSALVIVGCGSKTDDAAAPAATAGGTATAGAAPATTAGAAPAATAGTATSTGG